MILNKLNNGLIFNAKANSSKNIIYTRVILTIMISPPACGKGTQSELLCRTFNFKHLSAGELLRREVNLFMNLA